MRKDQNETAAKCCKCYINVIFVSHNFTTWDDLLLIFSGLSEEDIEEIW